LDLAALQSASGLQAAEFEASLRPAAAEADVKGVPLSIFNQMSPKDQRALMLGTETTRPTVLSEGAIAIDAMGNIIADNTKPETQTFTLSRGQQVVGRDGTIIAEKRNEDDKTFTLSEGPAQWWIVKANMPNYGAARTLHLSPARSGRRNRKCIAANASETDLSIHKLAARLLGSIPTHWPRSVLFQNDTQRFDDSQRAARCGQPAHKCCCFHLWRRRSLQLRIIGLFATAATA
jgi:hypothetical protein